MNYTITELRKLIDEIEKRNISEITFTIKVPISPIIKYPVFDPSLKQSAIVNSIFVLWNSKEYTSSLPLLQFPAPNLEFQLHRGEGKSTLIRIFQQEHPNLKTLVFVKTEAERKILISMGIKDVYVFDRHEISLRGLDEYNKVDIIFFDDMKSRKLALPISYDLSVSLTTPV